ncbi:hypothetical protein EV652_11455 [Kribbella steppae]|uniref:Uncharacterized protein n=1 Tax=Kribbella steppae TaxID=2512223 RepID=A0A4R2H250_9ACTN|nr:hypothetical protein EV652_11455 [Kribbella steppae]
MEATADAAAVDDSFGPAVIYAALVEEGVEFHFVGFVTHYAAEWYHKRRPAIAAGEANRHPTPKTSTASPVLCARSARRTRTAPAY